VEITSILVGREMKLKPQCTEILSGEGEKATEGEAGKESEHMLP
jgi:hypothetical protein